MQKITKFLREWETTSAIKSIKIDDFPIWNLMDEFIQFSYKYYPNLNEVIQKKDRKPSLKIHFMKYFFYIRYWIRGAYTYLFEREIPEGKRIVFIGHPIWTDRQDPYMYPLMKQFGKEYEKVLIDRPDDYYLTLSLNRLGEKRHQDELFNHLPLENFKLNTYVYLKELRRISREYRIWRKTTTMEYKGKDIWPEIKPLFDYYFEHRLVGHLQVYMMMRRMIRDMRPKAVVYPSEGGVFASMLFYLCKRKNIPVVAFQHGTLREDAKMAYLIPDYPMPTKLCVYGKAQKEFMINEAKYPEDKLVVTGNPMYDDISFHYDKKVICNDVGVRPDKKITLVIDSFAQEENRINLKTIAENSEQVVVKLHPNTKDMSIYDRIGIDSVVRDYTLNKLIFIADYVVVFGSGAGTLALAYDKPLLVLSFADLKSHLIADYGQKGAALEIFKTEEIPAALKRFEKDEFKKGRDKYVEENCMIIDGRANERIAEVVKGELK